MLANRLNRKTSKLNLEIYSDMHGSSQMKVSTLTELNRESFKIAILSSRKCSDAE